MNGQPAVCWRLHGQPIEILHAHTDPTSVHPVLGFHIRLPGGEERDIYWDENGEIDGFEYEETQQ